MKSWLIPPIENLDRILNKQLSRLETLKKELSLCGVTTFN